MENLKGKYIVACSGGPDSLALLDMARNNKLDVVVCCVNYNTRTTSYRDYEIVENYCRKYQLIFEGISVKYQSGNFEDWARNVRYDLFKKMYDKYKCNGILVAHHLDDLIETYYIQQKRNIIPNNYGLVYESYMGKYRIIRPLLSYTKDDLVAYLDNLGIVYGIDETNLEDHYLRNKIRINIVNKMSKEEKLKELAHITKLNEELNNKRNSYQQIIDNNTKYPLSLLDEVDCNIFFRMLLHNNLSRAYYLDLKKQVQSGKLELMINDLLLISEYGYFYVAKKPKDYTFNIKCIEELSNEYFKIVVDADKFHSCTVKAEDFPLTIRNFKPNDEIKMRYGTKKINRWFIDNKVARIKRYSWPIVLNCYNEIILVPQIGANLTHYSNNPNLFVLEL